MQGLCERFHKVARYRLSCPVFHANSTQKNLRKHCQGRRGEVSDPNRHVMHAVTDFGIGIDSVVQTITRSCEARGMPEEGTVAGSRRHDAPRDSTRLQQLLATGGGLAGGR